MTVTVEQAQNAMKDLIDRTARGEKVVITHDNKAVAELVAVPPEKPTPRFGSCKGMLEIVADDDEHLNDFKDYMPYPRR
jgi:antitoxin (DNA-binding transcriptional repressor) of toxin-antitoxin stability system